MDCPVQNKPLPPSKKMTTRIQDRLKSLQQEHEAGKKVLADLDAKRTALTTTILRIEGAMQVLQELLAQEDGPPDAPKT